MATIRDRGWKPPAVFNVLATLAVVAVAVVLASAAWRYYEYSPWTRDGRVRVYTVQVAPEVSGTVVDLPVADDQFVHKGDLLFRIDPGTFQNDVTVAEGQLAAARAQASYLAADARRRANLPDIAVSAEQQQNTAGQAQSAADTALQQEGALAQARLNLGRTELRAPTNGWINNLLLQRGGYAREGMAALTMIDSDSFWVEGYFEETQLPRIHPGDAVRMALMGDPRRPLTGHVVGIGRGIAVKDAAPGVQGLPEVDPVFTWVRLAQRVPVRVAIDRVPCGVVLASGLTATVTVLGKRTAPLPPQPACGGR